jgi:putative endonuclease
LKCGRSPPSALSGMEVVHMNAKDELGRLGEQLAADFLERSDLRILDRNWRCPDGEIDIVALERRTLVICEVKTRSSGRYGTPLEAISARKRVRLRKLAVNWVQAHGLFYEEIRIDVVGVLKAAPGEFSIEHVRGVG